MRFSSPPRYRRLGEIVNSNPSLATLLGDDPTAAESRNASQRVFVIPYRSAPPFRQVRTDGGSLKLVGLALALLMVVLR
jgi:hypothetical protein